MVASQLRFVRQLGIVGKLRLLRWILGELGFQRLVRQLGFAWVERFVGRAPLGSSRSSSCLERQLGIVGQLWLVRQLGFVGQFRLVRWQLRIMGQFGQQRRLVRRHEQLA